MGLYEHPDARGNVAASIGCGASSMLILCFVDTKTIGVEKPGRVDTGQHLEP